MIEILETCLYVDDLEAAERFYCQTLGLEFVDRQAGRHVFLRCGRSMLLLFNPTATRDPSSEFPLHGAMGPGHMAFAVAPGELDDWRRRLGSYGVVIERTIDWPNGARSLYFRDPAGNSLELATRGLWGFDTGQES